MIKTLLLISALTFNPLNTEGETEPPTSETEPTTPDEDKKEETPKADDEEDTTKEESFDWKAWLEQWFTPSQVAMIMTWITYAGTIIGLIAKCYSLAKQKTLTSETVKDLIMKELGDKVDESVKNQLTSAIVSLNKTAERQNEVLSLLAKVSALSQENTPESRIAILDLISRLGVVEKEDIESAKATITKEVEEKEIKEIETNNTVDKIIEEHAISSDDGTSI